MIIHKGQLLENNCLSSVTNELEEWCIASVETREDITEAVINACDVISQYIQAGKYNDIISPLMEQGLFTKEELDEATEFFSRKNLEKRYQIELGVIKQQIDQLNNTDEKLHREIKPQGVLFHIAAGNAQGLPFYSVIEGMLTGNVNLLKLPSADNGISVLLLYELILIEPKLAQYICVLDVPSTDIVMMKRLADMADAVVVWGGDEAIKAVRTFADSSTQIISWGHKLSFAYVTASCLKEFEDDFDKNVQPGPLKDLAKHICSTKQLLCSSCQGIFVETDSYERLTRFGKAFLDILEEESRNYPPNPIGVRGKIRLKQYNDMMEQWLQSEKESKYTYHKASVSVSVSMEEELVLSDMFGNCFVRPLIKENIVKKLKGKRGYLQTVGLICHSDERDSYVDYLAKAGAIRICMPADMSKTQIGSSHDGEYPLRRYTRVVESYC